MRKRAKKTTSRRQSTSAKPRDALAPILKWVGGATAVLSLVFELYQVVQIVGGIRAQQHQVAEFLGLGKGQQAARDYAAAWASFAKAAEVADAGGAIAKLTGSLSADQRRSREAQEDLAMAWIEDLHRPQGKTFPISPTRSFPRLSEVPRTQAACVRPTSWRTSVGPIFSGGATVSLTLPSKKTIARPWESIPPTHTRMPCGAIG